MSSRTPGAAAAKAEKKKKKELYSQLPSQYTLCPFAVETIALDTFREEDRELVRELGGRLRATTGTGDLRETS
jgi:hypothetical protein